MQKHSIPNTDIKSVVIGNNIILNYYNNININILDTNMNFFVV